MQQPRLVPGAQWEQRRDALARLPTTGQLGPTLLLSKEFRIASDGSLEVYWIPFERLNSAARIVIVGLTPGYSQMRGAFDAARQALAQNLSLEETMAHIDRQASFAGLMRMNMIKMLDDLGLADALGLQSTDELFADSDHLIHSTSALRYPVFVNSRNYSGSPDPRQTPILRRYLLELLAPELDAVSHAVVLPLGKAAQGCVQFLADHRLLDSRRCLFGFPHPSGANGHRLRQFAENRRSLSMQIADWHLHGLPSTAHS